MESRMDFECYHLEVCTVKSMAFNNFLIIHYDQKFVALAQ